MSQSPGGFETSQSHLSLEKIWERLGLISDQQPNISISDHSISHSCCTHKTYNTSSSQFYYKNVQILNVISITSSLQLIIVHYREMKVK